jgi:hypothetical protein
MFFFWKKVRKYMDIVKSIYLYNFEQREHNILDYQ